MATYVISARPESPAWADFRDDFDSGRIDALASDANLDEAYSLIDIEEDDAVIFRALSGAFSIEHAKPGVYIDSGGQEYLIRQTSGHAEAIMTEDEREGMAVVF